MRWLYSNLDNADERRERAAVIGAIDRWWNEFSRKTDDLHALLTGKSRWNLDEWMTKHLNAINPHLMWECGPGIPKGYGLIITPESHHELRPVVRTILDRAPKIANWSFYAYRLPNSLEEAQPLIQHLTRSDITNARFIAGIGECNRIDVTILWPDDSLDEKTASRATFLAVETLLGEEVLLKWIGAIDRDLGTEAPNSKPLKELKSTVDALIEKLRSSLPNKPCYQIDGAEWSLSKLDPKVESDYPGQLDMFVGRSMLPKKWQAAHRNRKFYSTSFSNCGETFCYVKLDGIGDSSNVHFKDQSEIEDALDAALRPEGLGCVAGKGTGRRYSYVDLAVTDVDRSIDVVKRVLRDGNIGRRAWVLFFDTELAGEWVGIWDDSPPPLLQSNE